jgi:hypothetical protein
VPFCSHCSIDMLFEEYPADVLLITGGVNASTVSFSLKDISISLFDDGIVHAFSNRCAVYVARESAALATG